MAQWKTRKRCILAALGHRRRTLDSARSEKLSRNLARMIHELVMRDCATGNPLAGLSGAQRARIKWTCHRVDEGGRRIAEWEFSENPWEQKNKSRNLNCKFDIINCIQKSEIRNPKSKPRRTWTVRRRVSLSWAESKEHPRTPGREFISSVGVANSWRA